MHLRTSDVRIELRRLKGIKIQRLFLLSAVRTASYRFRLAYNLVLIVTRRPGLPVVQRHSLLGRQPNVIGLCVCAKYRLATRTIVYIIIDKLERLPVDICISDQVGPIV